MSNIAELVKKGIEMGASDFHFKSFAHPAFRVRKKLIVQKDEVIDDKNLLAFLKDMIPDLPEDVKDFDTAFDFEGWRFRASIFSSEGSIAAVLRRLPKRIPDFKELNLPEVFRNHIFDSSGKLKIHKGLILITGETNSGKSTTLASIIREALENNPLVVITLEDPIEYRLPQNGKSIVYQREIGHDATSFARGLKSALREDPDMILVGEIRDAETLRIALSAALTGHIVLSTLHTNDAVSTIDRIRNMFPREEQQSILDALSRALYLIQSQRLVVNRKGEVIPVVEIFHNNPSMQTLIREEKINQIIAQMEMQKGHLTWDDCLAGLYAKQMIDIELAEELAKDRRTLSARISRSGW